MITLSNIDYFLKVTLLIAYIKHILHTHILFIDENLSYGTQYHVCNFELLYLLYYIFR